MSFVLRVLTDRYDRLVALRYYETEVRCLLNTIVNGIYLMFKEGLYSEVFYSLYYICLIRMRVDASTESLLSGKKKALLLVISFLETYSREKLDKVSVE